MNKQLDMVNIRQTRDSRGGIRTYLATLLGLSEKADIMDDVIDAMINFFRPYVGDYVPAIKLCEDWFKFVKELEPQELVELLSPHGVEILKVLFVGEDKDPFEKYEQYLNTQKVQV